MVHAPSVAEQDYLKQIYLEQEVSGRATTQVLAARLGVKPSSVTAMLKHLATDPAGPYVRHTPRRGVQLTDKGLAVALEMLRHHRLIELFLAELLDMPWDQLHAEAERLEHVLSEELEERIATRLGHPAFDPHGDPIPTRDGVIPRRNVVRLTTLPPAATGTVAQILQQEQPVLQYLESLGLILGAAVTVEAVAPFGGVMTVRVHPQEGDRGPGITHALGGELAADILVIPGSARRKARGTTRSNMRGKAVGATPSQTMGAS